MRHWNTSQFLTCHSTHTHSEELLFPGARVFFANSTGSGGKSTDPDEEDPKKKKSPLDAIRETMGDTLRTSTSRSPDDQLKQLEKLKKEGKISSTIYENAKRCARSSIGADRMLATRLIEGSVTAFRFNKLYSYLHGNQGDAHDIQTRRQAAELELTGKITPTAFDKVTEALESDSLDHQNAAEEFLKNPKSEKRFFAFMTQNKTKQATADILGQSAFENEEDRILKNLTAYNTLELNDYLKKKVDTPEQAEEMRNAISEFREESRVHSETWSSLTRDFDTQIGKGNATLNRAFELMVSHALPRTITESEASLTHDDLTRAMTKTGTQKINGQIINLENLIPPDFLHRTLEKLRYMQDLEQKVSKLDDKIKKDLRLRELACEKKQRMKMETEQCSRATGINLSPGTTIRYQMPIYHDNGTTEYRWVETEIEGVFPVKASGEVVDYGGKNFTDEETQLVVVTGAGREPFGRFKKWVMDTEAHQIIDTKENLDREIQFDAMRLPLKEGMELEQRIQTGVGRPGHATFETNLCKIEKLHDNGFIELDHEVDVYRAGSGTVRGEMLENPIRKKVFTYGEFAQWIKKWNVLPSLTHVTDAQDAYNSWRAVHGDTTAMPVTFTKGSYLAHGPYEQNSVLLVNDVSYDDASGKETARINDAIYEPTQILRAAQNAHFRAYDATDYATAASSLVPDATMRSQVFNSAKAQVLKKQSKLANLFGLENMAHNMEDEAEHDTANAGDTPPENNDPEENGKTADDKKPELTEAEKAQLKQDAEELKEAQNTIKPEASWLKTEWHESNFLTAQDVFQLGKSVWEYWNRLWERKMKNRYSKFGANLPYIGPEMLKIKEDTEHHEVGEYKHAYEAMPYGEVRGILNNSSNQDQIKACIEVLVDKGQMRWDDVRTWKAINRIGALANDKRIPIPKDGNPYSIVGRDKNSGTKMNGMDYIGDAVKSIWGGTDIYDGWESKNNSSYTSGMEKWNAKGEQMENDPKNNGGVTALLGMLLSQQMEGEEVDPQQYEGLIRFVIKNGKSDAENKMYLIVMGVATNLLTIDRVGAIDSTFCNVLPWLDYFTDKKSDKPVSLTKNQSDVPPKSKEVRPFTKGDYKEMAEFFENEGGKKKSVPGKNVKNFLWKKVLPHKATQTRTSKGSRNADQMDHDDSHFILPLLDYESIRNMCGSSTGDKKYFSVPGYLNGFPGFSEWMKTLAELGDEEKLEKAILSYVNFDGILSGRFLLGDNKKQRITDTVLNDKNAIVVDPGTPVNFHRGQVQEMILNIGRAAGKGEKWQILFDKVKRSQDDPKGDKQKAIETAIKDFGPELKDAISTIKTRYGKDGLFKIVGNANLKGYEGSPDPETAKRISAKLAESSTS